MKKRLSILLILFCALGFSIGTLALNDGRFEDVSNNHFAFEAIEWAANNDLVKGDDDKNTFRPDDAVSRADLVLTLKRYNDLIIKKRSFNRVFSDHILHALASGATIEEVENPDLELPKDIDENQIKLYFKMDNFYYALVLRPSLNIALGPLLKDGRFGGILIAEENQNQWHKFLEIKDIDYNRSGKNNPYYLWTKNGMIFLSIVDHNGAGSGEGGQKIYTTSNGKEWKILNDCYFFAPFGYIDENEDGHGDWLEYVNKYGYFKASSLLEHIKTGSEIIDFETLRGNEPSEAWKEELLNGCKDDVELVSF